MDIITDGKNNDWMHTCWVELQFAFSINEKSFLIDQSISLDHCIKLYAF